MPSHFLKEKDGSGGERFYLEFYQPGTTWSEALLAGDGTLGVAVYGGVARERIALTHNTFYSGARQHFKRKNSSKAFQNMRQALLEKEYKRSVKAAEDFIGIRGDYGTNLPVGDVHIDFDCDDVIEHREDYQRKLCITNGIGYVRNMYNGQICEREFFVNHQDHGFYYFMKGKASMSCNIGFGNPKAEVMTFVKAQQYHFAVQALEKIHSDGKKGVQLEGVIQILDCDGDVTYTDQGIEIKGFTQCVLRVATETDFDLRQENLKGVINHKVLAALPMNLEYKKIRKIHSEEVERFMRRVSLSFNGGDDLSEFMLQYGRYLLFASSREDSLLPTHLQGIWNDDVACQIGWTCDMHLDINTQMNYWLSEAGNLSECHKPLFRWMQEVVLPSGRKTARDYYGLPGWSADLVTNSWGYTHPYWSATISPCPTSGAWMASDFVEHYKYHKDKTFLKERALPVLEEAVEFFVHYVFEHQGHVACGPSISPENSYLIQGERYYFLLDSTYERLMIYELFQQYIMLCQASGKQGRFQEKVEKLLKDFNVYKVTKEGCIAEFLDDMEEYDPQHRHTSHLLGVYPYRHISPEKTPQLASAAYKSIQQRLEPYERWEDTGWARSMIMLYMARLKCGEEAYWHMNEMYAHLLNPNYLVIHPPTRGATSFDNVYELDGNTGVAMCILEMLVQSHDTYIELLPALPEKWQTGYVKGVRGYDDIEINLRWEKRKLKTAEFTSKQAVKVRYAYQGCYQTVYIDGEQTKKIEFI